jgi:hypothetical protein
LVGPDGAVPVDGLDDGHTDRQGLVPHERLEAGIGRGVRIVEITSDRDAGSGSLGEPVVADLDLPGDELLGQKPDQAYRYRRPRGGARYQLLFPLVRVNFELGVIMVIAVSCVKLLSAHNSTQHTSRKHKV